MKRIAMLLALLCTLCACGSSRAEAQSAAAQFSFETDRITVYDLTDGTEWEITDKAVLTSVAEAAKPEQWVPLEDIKAQVSAVAVYMLDFHNGTCIGYLGDGYVQGGTAFSFLSEERSGYHLENSTQYQVNTAFTDCLADVLGY